MPALQNGADGIERKAARHAEQIHRQLRHAAHGVHVGERVRCGDLTEEVALILFHSFHCQLYAFPVHIYAEYLYAYMLVNGHYFIRV